MLFRSDGNYETWLMDYIRKENPQDSLERGIKEMISYAEDNPDLKNGYKDYFRYGNVNRICHHIASGRITPWVVFNCKSGIEFIERLDEIQLQIVMPYIEPGFWNKKFIDYIADTEWTKNVLRQAGL